MIVEQFLKDIQKLINRGTINPSAEMTIEGEIEIHYDDINYVGNFIVGNLEIDINQCSYNKLTLINEPDG